MVHMLSIPPDASRPPPGERQQAIVQLDCREITFVLLLVHVSHSMSLESREPEARVRLSVEPKCTHVTFPR